MAGEKKKIVRLVVFLLALAVAVGSITMGVVGLLHRDSGYYDVDYTAEGKLTLYGSGVHLRYYADGGSGDIRTRINEVQKAYTDSLLFVYRLLDEKNLYEGVTNLASLNAHPGEWQSLPPELESVLRQAMAYSQQNQGYTLFAGALKQEWETLRYLEEPQPRDPLNDAEERQLLNELAAFLGAEDTFTLEIENGQARLTVSEPYSDWAREHEIEAPVLDLNLMKDAYLLDYTAAQLTKQGYLAGYLYTDSGLSVKLSPNGETAYRLYAASGKGIVEAGEISLKSPSAFCLFSAVPLNETTYGYYTVSRDGNTAYRHPYFSALTGDVNQIVSTAALGGSREQLPELAYQMIVLNACGSEAETKAWQMAVPREIFACYSLGGEEGVLYANQADSIRLLPESGVRAQ